MSDLVEGVEGDGVVKLEVGGGKAAQDWPVVSVYGQPSPLDLTDEVSDGELDGQELPPVGRVEALLWTQGLAPESQWDSSTVD